MAETLVRQEGYVDGHYVDLDTLQADLSFLQQLGSRGVILAFASWWGMDGEMRFGSSVRGEGQYDYTYIGFYDWYGSPPIHIYEDGERSISGCHELSPRGVHHVGPILERWFENGAVVRIVTDPTEIEDIEFSYEGSRGGKDLAIASMPIAEDFRAIR